MVAEAATVVVMVAVTAAVHSVNVAGNHSIVIVNG
jgi:hypothetical protein